MLRGLVSFLLIALALYVGLALLLYVFQSRFVYFPTRAVVATPDRIGLAYQAVTLYAADGVRLSAWFIPAPEPRGVVLFCHGNAGNISHRLDSIALFHRLGFSTLIFDYRGYGESEGRPSEKGTYLDAQAAWDYLAEEQGFAPDQIVIFGRSMGGAVAAWLAQETTPRALIVESTFTSVADMGAELYPYLPIRLLARYRYSAVEYVRQANCPVLVVHSRHDEMIPFSQGQRLYEVAGEPKEFLEIQGTHNEGFLTSGKLYEQGLEGFLSRYGE
jgi:fermentation-respiration switch protein FrsA (DUF1100 family)